MIVDPTDSPRKAFVKAFFKGVAAPLMLFADGHVPAAARPREFEPLPDRTTSPAGDWAHVGDSLRVAATRYRATRGRGV